MTTHGLHKVTVYRTREDKVNDTNGVIFQFSNLNKAWEFETEVIKRGAYVHFKSYQATKLYRNVEEALADWIAFHS